MGAAASSRIRIFRGWLPRQVGLLPARGGEKPIEGYARRSSWDAFSGRGFDSHHLHQVCLPAIQDNPTIYSRPNAAAMLRSYGARSTPTSVMIAVISSAG